MRKKLSSRRISSAMASRNASRTVCVTVGPLYSFSSPAGARLGCGATPAAGLGGLAPATPSPRAPRAGGDRTGAGAAGALFRAPALAASPGFLCHLASLPSVIVGDSAGISTSIGMAPSPSSVGVDVGPQLRGIGFGALLREIGGGGDDVLDLFVDLLEPSLVGHAAIDEALLHLVDRVVLLAHAAHFVLAAVFRRIGHGVAAIAVGLHLQNVGALSRARVVERLVGRLLHRDDVHAVDLVAGDVEGRAAAYHIVRARPAPTRPAHAVFVVLDDVDHGELPQRRHVEALIDLALVHRAVAEIGDADLVVVAIFVLESQAGAERHLRADDAVPAEEALLLREHVHRAALAPGIAAAPAGELGHDALGV